MLCQGALLENPTARGLREFLLQANDFNTCYTVNFPKTHSHFGGLENNQRHEIQSCFFARAFLHMNSI